MRRFLSPYRVLFAMPRAKRFIATTYVARLGMAMFGVAIVVMIASRRDSYATAGLVSLVGLGSMAVGGPVLARFVDRHGQRRVALPAGLFALACLLALAGETYLGAPTWALLLTNTGQAFAPAVGTLVRSRWAHVLEGDSARLHIANSFEQVSEESNFVLGPALGAGLATWLFPEAGLLLATALFATGFVGLMAHTESEPPVHLTDDVSRGSAFRVPGIVQLGITMILTGAVFGSGDVVILAYADEQGARAWGGFLIGLFAAGSLIGGLLYGLVDPGERAANRVLLFTGSMFAGFAPLLVVPNLWVLGINGFVAGLAVAPTLITAMVLCQRLVPAAQLNEGMTIVVTGLLIGVGLGSAIAGRWVESYGAHAAFLVPVAAAGIAAVVALLGRAWLMRAEERALAAPAARAEVPA